jgi:hypothetical protein
MNRATDAAGSEPATTRRNMRRAIVQLALAILFLSFTPILFRWSEIGPSATAFYRAVLTIPFFAAWVAVERRGAGRPRFAATVIRGSNAWLIAVGGALFAANMVAYAWAVHLTLIANASWTIARRMARFLVAGSGSAAAVSRFIFAL